MSHTAKQLLEAAGRHGGDLASETFSTARSGARMIAASVTSARRKDSTEKEGNELMKDHDMKQKTETKPGPVVEGGNQREQALASQMEAVKQGKSAAAFAHYGREATKAKQKSGEPNRRTEKPGGAYER